RPRSSSRAVVLVASPRHSVARLLATTSRCAVPGRFEATCAVATSLAARPTRSALRESCPEALALAVGEHSDERTRGQTDHGASVVVQAGNERVAHAEQDITALDARFGSGAARLDLQHHDAAEAGLGSRHRDLGYHYAEGRSVRSLVDRGRGLAVLRI